MTTPRYGGWLNTDVRSMTTSVEPIDRRGPARLWNHPAGWVMRRRGDVDGTVTLEYLCPVHGRFEARVSRSESPDEVPCPGVSWAIAGFAEEYSTRLAAEDAVRTRRIDPSEVRLETSVCAASAPWSPSKFAAWQSSGEVKT